MKSNDVAKGNHEEKFEGLLQPNQDGWLCQTR